MSFLAIANFCSYYQKTHDAKAEDSESALPIHLLNYNLQQSEYPLFSLVLGLGVVEKPKSLKVLDRPDLPIHNNAPWQDIREFVTKRKISGSTRSDEGRKCRDTFASLKKTVTQARSFLLGIPHRPSVWQKGDSAFGGTDCPKSGKPGHARRYYFSVFSLRNPSERTQTY